MAVELGIRRGSPLTRLTQRQFEVLSLIARGYTNASVAGAICVEEKTVENYINAIYQELHLASNGVSHPRVVATLTFLYETRFSESPR
jgi:DNA-binding NarL/FixJ family response regulator